MILETDQMLKHVGINLNFIERPDLKHTDSSVVYLPYRVCEDCYLLFETMNDVKISQIAIANFFRNPVNPLNFGVEIYKKNKTTEEVQVINEKDEKEKKNIFSMIKKNSNNSNLNLDINNNSSEKNFNDINYNTNNFNNSNKNLGSVNNLFNIIENAFGKKKISRNYLYRFLIIFTDVFWNENIPVPNKDLYVVFHIFGNWYKIKLNEYYSSLDYFNINFFKMFYVICDETHGFIEYIDKNRHLLVKIGYFNEDLVKKKENELFKIFRKEIIIEDLDICDNYDQFVPFCSVDLSLNAVRYADKYRNTLNGLLFKEDKPHYVGKLRCLIRVNKEKEVDIEKLNYRKHFNVRFY